MSCYWGCQLYLCLWKRLLNGNGGSKGRWMGVLLFIWMGERKKVVESTKAVLLSRVCCCGWIGPFEILFFWMHQKNTKRLACFHFLKSPSIKSEKRMRYYPLSIGIRRLSLENFHMGMRLLEFTEWVRSASD